MVNGIRLILHGLANTFSGEIDMAGKPVEHDPFAKQSGGIPVEHDPFAPKKRSWMDVAGESFSSIPQSAANMASGLYEAVTSPVQTVSGLMDVAAGSLQNALPKPVVDFVNKFDADPQAAQRAVQAANAAGGMVKERYGSMDAIKNTLATDPVGAAGDLSLLLSGGGGLAARIPVLARTAPTLGKVASMVDPINLAGKAVGKTYDLAGWLTKQGLGFKTGVGTEPITQAVQSGREGNPAFIENLRGDVPAINVLDDAKANLTQMNLNKQKDYRSGMVDIKNDKSVLDLSNVEDALKNAENTINFKQSNIPKDAKAVEVLKNIRKKIDEWKKLDPVEYHTPEGLDHLKQSLWEDFGKLGQEEKTAYSVGKQVYDSVKNEIGKQAPTYEKVMKEYTDASDLTKEIERSLSLGQKASADTAMRKLQSLMRNNVNTNYGQRLDLAQQLQTAGGKNIMPALAGQAMSDWTPRGIQRATAGLEGMGAYALGGPALAALDIGLSSPRLVGETSYKYGQLANALTQGGQAISNAIPMTAKQARLAALLGSQSNPYAIGEQ
jgi:hypothetical protein